MSTALIQTPATSNGYGREQIELLKTTICAGSTDAELALFVEATKRLGLDPFARQVFAVKRWDNNARREVMSIQVSVDGFRLVAERTGKYAGQLGPFWTADGKEWLEVWLSSDPPAAAKVAVLRHDFKEPVWSVATWAQYKQTKRDGGLTGMWAKMGPLMLAKCAESLALRRAFPNELSGVYTSEEMQQAAPDYEAPEVSARAEVTAAIARDDVRDANRVPPGAAVPTGRSGSAATPPTPLPSGSTPKPDYLPGNQVPFAPPLATAGQVRDIHILLQAIGWPDGEVDETKPVSTWPLYRQALAAYRVEGGKRCLSSKELGKAQADNLIRRMQAQKRRNDARVERATEEMAQHLGAPVSPADLLEKLHGVFISAVEESEWLGALGFADTDAIPDESRLIVCQLAAAWGAMLADKTMAGTFQALLQKARVLGHVTPAAERNVEGLAKTMGML